MTAFTLGHPLAALCDGVTGFAGEEPRPVPLTAMRVEVAIAAGLAVVTTTRTFRNGEDKAIEAVLTFPVAFDAVVTGLRATVEGRTLVAQARDRAAARQDYEEAVGRGKLAVLHEEALKGVHVLSVGNLGAGAEVAVTVETVSALADLGSVALLRIPTTVGALYGTSPLLPADDLVIGPGARTTATVVATADAGRVLLDGVGPMAGEACVPLDRPIVLRVEDAVFGERKGVDASGRPVRIALRRAGSGEAALDCAILFDRSGSTGGGAGVDGRTVWDAMKVGLAETGARLRPADRVSLWQFDSSCEQLGEGRGPRGLAALIDRIGTPHGGTELGAAIDAVARAGGRDVLVLTDGQTHASEAHEAATRGCRVSALLVGDGSLDAGVGHLAAMTGGDVVWAPAGAVGAAIARLLNGLRLAGRAMTGDLAQGEPVRVAACRGGVAIDVAWDSAGASGTNEGADTIGRYAAAIALPLIPKERAGAFAAAHGLCTQFTSLVLVDEAGATQAELPEMRKVTLMELQYGARQFSVMHDVGSMPAAPRACFSEAPPMRLASSTAPRFLMREARASGGASDRIDWAIYGPRIAQGDLSQVPRTLLLRLRSVARDPDLVRLAAALGVDPMLVALALLAMVQAASDRHAQRVAQKILGTAPLDLIELAREAFTRTVPA